MWKQQEAKLLEKFRKMTNKDRELLIKYAEACVKENPKKNDHLKLVVGGSGSS